VVNFKVTRFRRRELDMYLLCKMCFETLDCVTMYVCSMCMCARVRFCSICALDRSYRWLRDAVVCRLIERFCASVLHT
jgi:hypothetical protein